jgi:hypothetical protein
LEILIVVLLYITVAGLAGAIGFYFGNEQGKLKALDILAQQAPVVKKKRPRERVASFDSSDLLNPITPEEQRLERNLDQRARDRRKGDEDDG